MTVRRLLLFRHSKTESLEPGSSDTARALIARGRADAATIGAYIARHALMPDRVLLSPAKRAQETWALAASMLRPAPAMTGEPRIYEASARMLLEIVREAPADAATLLLIGHNPGLHEFARLLVATGDIEARERLAEKMPTSGLAVIDFAFRDWSKIRPQTGRLERFVSPRSIETATN